MSLNTWWESKEHYILTMMNIALSVKLYLNLGNDPTGTLYEMLSFLFTHLYENLHNLEYRSDGVLTR